MTNIVTPIAHNLAQVQERIAQAAQRAGRDPAGITLVAVTKTQPPDDVRAVVEAGVNDVGENRIEDAAPKMAAVDHPGVRWHMIGHVQSRKARTVIAAQFTLIHSVDSFKLAERLSRLAAEAGRVQPILLECNVSGESAKSGFPLADTQRWAEWLPEVERLAQLPNLHMQGLMTMAPMVEHPELTRPYFARLRALRDYLSQHLPSPSPAWAELSMGMTDDFESAIAEGATLVRVGRAIFGERNL
jgi:hypothetical protein